MPRIGSVPTSAIIRPRTAAISALTGDALAEAGGRGDAERGEQEIFGRGEAQREVAERRRDEDQREDRGDAGEERADRRDAERRAGAALAGELVAVDGRHDARRIRRAR